MVVIEIPGRKACERLAVQRVRGGRSRLDDVSCSQGNRYGHPHEEALGRMEQTCGGIFCTMDLGQITVRMGEKGVKVYGFSSSGVLK